MGSLLGSSSSSHGKSTDLSKGFSSSSSSGTSSSQGSSSQIGSGTTTGQTTGTYSGTTTGQEATQGLSSTNTSETTNVSSQYGQILAKLAQQGLSEIDPVTQEYITQLQSILNGNEYTGSSIPEIKAGVDQAQQAGAQGLLESQNYLAKTGTDRGSFGADVLSQSAMSAQEATGAVPTEIANAFIQGLPSFLEGMTSIGYKGLADAAATNYTSATTGKSTTQYAQDTSTAQQQQGKFQTNTLQNYINQLNSQFNVASANQNTSQDYSSGINQNNQSSHSSQNPGFFDLLTAWLFGGGGNPFS